MSRRPRPRPFNGPGELRLIDLVRDYPETLAVLRKAGVDLRKDGPTKLRELHGGDDLEREVETALAWRPGVELG